MPYCSSTPSATCRQKYPVENFQLPVWSQSTYHGATRAKLMFLSRIWPGLWRWAAVALALSAGLLTGCAAPTVQARVTSFQQWPSDVAGQTYRFADAGPGRAGNLEYQSYQDSVRAGIGPTGLVEAQAGQPARFTVSFEYGSEQTQIMRSEEHTSELQSLMRISYAVFCLKKQIP